jgi:adenylate kinase
MLNLIIFGPPGSGKGTQAELIAKKYKLTHLSSGDILRRELKNGALGKKIKQYQDNGQLVPDEIIIAMMEAAAVKKIMGRGFVFDGYPRNLKQAKSLDKFLRVKKIEITTVLNLKLSEAEASHRILLRSRTSGRSDDNLKTIKNRHKVYREQTAPLLKYYRAQKKLINIDGRPAIPLVAKEIKEKLVGLQ